MLSEAGRPEKALECYNMAVMLDPANVEALVYKGTTLTELSHYDEALDIFNRILNGPGPVGSRDGERLRPDQVREGGRGLAVPGLYRPVKRAGLI
jgi:tetratricopeptide (TPR) repeat protein